MNERIAKVLEGLDAGRITAKEADAYLRAACGTTLDSVRPVSQTTGQVSPPGRPSHPFMLALIIMVVVGVTGFVYYGDVTGFIVLDIPQENVTNRTYSIPPVLGLNITGVLYGDGTATIWLDTPAGTHLVGTIDSEDGLPRTDKAGYGQGELVSIINAPENASYYFDDGTSTAVDIPFPAASGDLLIVTPDATYRLPIIIGAATRATAFTELCVETCEMEETAGTLRIETTGESFLELTTVQGTRPNSPPQGTLGPLEVIGETTINLDDHFTDVDGDDLYYDVGTSNLVTASIDGSILTLTPIQAGSGYLIVYASDLVELVPVTIAINVTLPVSSDVPDSTATFNDTAPVTNSTLNTTTLTENPETTAVPIPVNSSSNTTLNITLECSGGNPNTLSEECLLMSPDTYFPEQDIFWENSARQRVARFTVIGNLLLTGDIIEQSTARPAADDFSLGYVDDDYDTIPTIWIDGKTGDLHLRGRLVEESANLSPPQGSYTVTTRRKVHLAYADLAAGDLHLRGNAIPYRRSIS